MSEAKELVQVIRSALGDDADDLLKQRATKACDQLLAVLSAEPGQPLLVPPPAATAATPVVVQAGATPSAQEFSPATQMLDALIAKLKDQLPKEGQDAKATASKRLSIPFVPIPGLLGTGD